MSEARQSVDSARVELYDIMQQETDFQDKVQAVLSLGKDYFGVDNAHLTRINPVGDRWEIIASTGPPDGPFPSGLSLDLTTTYCRHALQADSSVALHDVPAQGWADDPAFETQGLQCYHGTQLTVDNEVYGTVCFVSESPRAEPFSDADTLFAELIARLLEHELNYSRQVEENTRRANSITVLSRVLRHNLRNEMTVVRGRTDMLAKRLAAQTDDDVETGPLFKSIDRIINLSDKARKLESVVATQFDREPIALNSLFDRVTTNITSQFSEADIEVEVPAESTISAAPSLELAITELVENAAKHAGPAPEVLVTTTLTTEAVEISVLDNGPGLPEAEQAVLAKGVETPLKHGSGLGLWMVYWIVTTHNGNIETVVTDDGTTVTVTVPQMPDDATVNAQDIRTLQRGRDRFEALFQESFNVMLLLNDDQRIIDANKYAVSLLGDDERGLLGRQIDEFVMPSFDIVSAWEELQATGQTTGEAPVRSADGSEYIFEYRVVADIVPGQHFLVGQDITERKERERELKQAHRQLQTVLDTAECAIFLKDSAGKYQVMNSSARMVLDIDSDRDITGLTDFDLFPEAVARQYQADDQRVLDSGESIEIEEEVPTNRGSRTYLTIKSPVFDESGTVSGVCAVGTDITARKEQKQLERENERLEEFAGFVSHDLRNPLHVANANLELVRQTNDSDELAAVARAHERMETLIQELLTLAREGEDVTEVETVELGSLVDGCWENVETREATLVREVSGTVQANRVRLSQLFENLIRNAVEHGGDCVTVTITPLPDGFSVADDGPGMQESSDRASDSSLPSGDGFGLEIIETVVEAHGWEISVTESPDGGAQFDITGVDVDR